MSIISTILHATSLIASLPQTATNGLSLLGTLSAPTLQPFLTGTNVILTDGFPWGDATTSNTNPYYDAPNNTVYHTKDFYITRGFIAPDGVNKSVLLINGQFPGPTLEANWGDMFNITVHNQITGPEEGTALHWHGLLQTDTPWFDGVPSVQQCPIPPGQSLTYTFKADLYGTSWYHSHYSAQYAGGLFGPMIIHGPSNVPYDIDLGPILLSDYYHTEYFKLVEEVMTPGAGPPASDNNLINGKMDFDCSIPTAGNCTSNAGLSTFRFQTGKTHRLRLINAGAEGIQRFTIDNHTMTVIANDFVPVEPYQTNVVTLGIGQRTDVLVKATSSSTSKVWMRSDISGNCSVTTPGQNHALAVIYYPNADTTSVPQTTAQLYNDAHCGNDALSVTVPTYRFTPPAHPATTKEIDITFAINQTGFGLFQMNNQTFRADYNQDLLLLANEGNTSYPYDPEWNVYNFGFNTSIRLVVRNFFPASHPMHLHGHNFWVLSEGPGDWNQTIVNPRNPQRRDVQIIQPSAGFNSDPSHLVIEFNADNPGVWPFHCHIAWHVSAGLYINVLERPDLIRHRHIPEVVNQTCNAWNSYTARNIVDEIDSGL